VALAKQLGLGLVFGMNYLNAGDGSSGIPGTASHPDHWQMSPAEVYRVGALLVQAPYSCAFLSWHYAAKFVGRQDVRAAWTRSRGPRRRGAGPPACGTTRQRQRRVGSRGRCC
jgi:hypothetical protein